MSNEFDKEVPDQAPLLRQRAELDENELQAMQDAGRYTLEGAAKMLERHGNATPGKMLKSLKNTVSKDAGKATNRKKLPLHNPEYSDRLEQHTIRTFYEVATAENLNNWLKKAHPEITWRFPKPNSQKVGAGGTEDDSDEVGKVDASEAVDKTPQERRADAAASARGTKREILEQWDEIAKTYGPDADAAKVARTLKKNRDVSAKAPSRKTIHNRLGELRAAGLIP